MKTSLNLTSGTSEILLETFLNSIERLEGFNTEGFKNFSETRINVMETEFMDESGHQIPVKFRPKGIHIRVFSYVRNIVKA